MRLYVLLLFVLMFFLPKFAMAMTQYTMHVTKTCQFERSGVKLLFQGERYDIPPDGQVTLKTAMDLTGQTLPVQLVPASTNCSSNDFICRIRLQTFNSEGGSVGTTVTVRNGATISFKCQTNGLRVPSSPSLPACSNGQTISGGFAGGMGPCQCHGYVVSNTCVIP